MQKQIAFLIVSLGLISHVAYPLDPVIQNETNPNIAISNEEAMRAYAGLATYRRIIKAAQEANQTSSVRRSGAEVAKIVNQFSNNLEKHLKTYLVEFAKKLDADERVIVEDVATDIKVILELVRSDVPKLFDEAIDPSAREALGREFNGKMEIYVNQLGDKLAPFFFVAQEQKMPDQYRLEVQKHLRALHKNAEDSVDGFIAMLRAKK